MGSSQTLTQLYIWNPGRAFWASLSLGIIGGGCYRLPDSENIFTEAVVIRRPPSKMNHFWRRLF
jgi:hypothetical protein